MRLAKQFIYKNRKKQFENTKTEMFIATQKTNIQNNTILKIQLR